MKEFLNFLNDIYGVTPNTVFTVLTSISVFLLGIFVSWVQREIAKCNRRVAIRKLVFAILDNLISELESQQEDYRRLFEQLVITYVGNYYIMTVKTFSHQLIMEISYEKIFSAFKRRLGKKTRDSFSNLWKVINSCQNVIIKHSEITERFLVDLRRVESNRQDAIRYIASYIENLIMKAKRGEIEEGIVEYLKKIDCIYAEYQKKENYRRADIANDFLIKPIHELFLTRKYTKFLDSEITRRVVDALQHFESLINLLGSYSGIASELTNLCGKNVKEIEIFLFDMKYKQLPKSDNAIKRY